MGNREQKRISLTSIVPRPPSSGAGFFLFWMATLVVAAALFALGWMFLIYPDSDGPRTAQAEVVVGTQIDDPFTKLTELSLYRACFCA